MGFAEASFPPSTYHQHGNEEAVSAETLNDK